MDYDNNEEWALCVRSSSDDSDLVEAFLNSGPDDEIEQVDTDDLGPEPAYGDDHIRWCYLVRQRKRVLLTLTDARQVASSHALGLNRALLSKSAANVVLAKKLLQRMQREEEQQRGFARAREEMAYSSELARLKRIQHERAQAAKHYVEDESKRRLNRENARANRDPNFRPYYPHKHGTEGVAFYAERAADRARDSFADTRYRTHPREVSRDTTAELDALWREERHKST